MFAGSGCDTTYVRCPDPERKGSDKVSFCFSYREAGFAMGWGALSMGEVWLWLRTVNGEWKARIWVLALLTVTLGRVRESERVCLLNARMVDVIVMLVS